MTGVKADESKAPMALLPFLALEQVARVMQYGLKKYARDNWKKIEDRERLVSAMLRHYKAIQEGEDYDDESGLLHASHLACDSLMFLYLVLRSGLSPGTLKDPPRYVCPGCLTNGKHECKGEPCKCLECLGDKRLPFSGDGNQPDKVSLGGLK